MNKLIIILFLCPFIVKGQDNPRFERAKDSIHARHPQLDQYRPKLHEWTARFNAETDSARKARDLVQVDIYLQLVRKEELAEEDQKQQWKERDIDRQHDSTRKQRRGRP